MNRKLLITGLVLTGFCASAVHAAPWNGTATNFTYASTPGGDGAGMFSTPTAVGNFLSFTTPGFTISSVDGVSESADGYVEFIVTIQAGYHLDFVSAAVGGSINVAGEGSMVDLDVTWTVTDVVFPAQTMSQTIDGFTSPIAFPYTYVDGGPFNNAAFAGVNTLGGLGSQIPPFGQQVTVRLDMGVVADTLDDGAANINLFGSNLELGFFFVPEPATATLLLACGAVLCRSRRRR